MFPLEPEDSQFSRGSKPFQYDERLGHLLRFFKYSCLDRVVLRDNIIRLFFAEGIAVLLRALGFNSLSNGVMRILTDPLNSHIEKIAKAQNIPIHWRPSVDGGTDGAKQKYVQEKYAAEYKEKDNHVYCVLTDNEPSQTFACRELTSKTGKKFERLYKCRKPVKQHEKSGSKNRRATLSNQKSL